MQHNSEKVGVVKFHSLNGTVRPCLSWMITHCKGPSRINQKYVSKDQYCFNNLLYGHIILHLSSTFLKSTISKPCLLDKNIIYKSLFAILYAK